MIELALVLPLLMVAIMATVDLGRLIYVRQVLTDLSRESGNLVSRGSTPQDAFMASASADEPLDIENEGTMIITTVRRRDHDDDRPWVFDQVSEGSLSEHSSRIGRMGGPANIPGVESLERGVTIMGVEIYHSFQPLFRLDAYGLNFYPEIVYDVSFF